MKDKGLKELSRMLYEEVPFSHWDSFVDVNGKRQEIHVTCTAKVWDELQRIRKGKRRYNGRAQKDIG